MKITAMNKRILLRWSTGILLLLLTGCYKYERLPDVQDAAYLRVFNSIPYSVDVLHAGQAPPFLCMLIDPEFDEQGIPSGGAIEGDFLATRDPFSASYSMNAGTGLDAGNGGYAGTDGRGGLTNRVTNSNPEYPGKLRVRTAPSMNGFDLSAWAQVPAGKHRIVFVVRPEDNTAFRQLPALKRKWVLVDTVLELKSGEIQTLNVLTTDRDKNQYGVSLRQEQFVKRSFDPGQLYVTFYNLSGKRPFLASDSKYPDYSFFKDTIAIKYTYYIFNDNFEDLKGNIYKPLPQSNNVYLTTLYRQTAPEQSPFLALPFLPRDYFFDEKGMLRTFFREDKATAYRTGTMPFFAFDFVETSDASSAHGQSRVSRMNCSVSQAAINNINLSRLPAETGILQGQLNLFTQIGGQIRVFPTVNIFELIDNHVYMMQVQQAFEKLPRG